MTGRRPLPDPRGRSGQVARNEDATPRSNVDVVIHRQPDYVGGPARGRDHLKAEVVEASNLTVPGLMESTRTQKTRSVEGSLLASAGQRSQSRQHPYEAVEAREATKQACARGRGSWHRYLME